MPKKPNQTSQTQVPNRQLMTALMEDSASRHQHLCPRQVLGIRIGLAGLRFLGLVNPMYEPRFQNLNKRLLTIVETDGCGSDGIGVATDCVVGRRTLRVLDFGKVAATLVDTPSGSAVRIAPALSARLRAAELAPSAPNLWHSYLESYQTMPDDQLLSIQPVQLTRSLTEILSRPGLRVHCECCGEEIMNEREVMVDGSLLCRACAGEAYYRIVPTDRVG